MEPRSLDGMAAFIRRACMTPRADSEPGEAVDASAAGEPIPALVGSEPPSPCHDEVAAGEDGREADWRLAEQARETGQAQEATVVGWNRGGLLVHWRNLQGFLPASQLQRMIRYSTDDERDAAFASRVGEMLRLRIIEVDRARKRLVFSERALLWGPGNGQCLWQDLRPGQVRRGRVRNLCDFGAFVDLGGIDGLIHISELSWRHIRHPSDVLQIGQDVDAYVMSVEPERKRVALSLKKLTEDPWQRIEQRYHVGETIVGTVTNVLNFGAFVRIEEGVEGLIHISEFGDGNVAHPRDAVSEGTRLAVRIIGIDSASRRLALSLRMG